MEIKEFGQAIAREVKGALGSEYCIDFRDVLKNNGVIYHAITIRKQDENVAPTIYIDQMYEKYKRGVLLSSLVTDVLIMYRQSAPRETIDVDFFSDFSLVSEKLFFKVVNYKKNKEKLKDVPIKRIMDLALVPVCFYQNEHIDEGSIMIQNSHLAIWEITKEELWENISESAPKVAPPKIKDLLDFLERMTGESQREEFEACCGMYVVTNKCENFGAGSILYPGLLKSIADDHESDLFIIPSSVHECIVIPDSAFVMDTDSMREMIHEVNRTALVDEDILSDNLYMYDRQDDRFFIVKE